MTYLKWFSQQVIVLAISFLTATAVMAGELPSLSTAEAERLFMEYKEDILNPHDFFREIRGNTIAYGHVSNVFKNAKARSQSRKVGTSKYGKDKAVVYISTPGVSTESYRFDVQWRIVYEVDIDRWSVVSVEVDKAVSAGKASAASDSIQERPAGSANSRATSAPEIQLTKDDVQTDPSICRSLQDNRTITVTDIAQNGTRADVSAVCEDEKWAATMKFTYVLSEHNGKPMWMTAGEKFISQKRK